jgi:hypothetical protein
MIPDDPNARLPREEMAAALTEAGYPIAGETLATKASRGGGPPYEKFGRRAIYTWQTSLAWARAQTKGPIRSTSDLHAPPKPDRAA